MFTYDVESVLAAAAALVNTEPVASHTGVDQLAGVDDIARFFAEWEYTGAPARTHRELDEVRAVRGELRAFFVESRDEVAEHVNRVLRDAVALPQLLRHDSLDWHLHTIPDNHPFAERILVETAMALVDVVRFDETSRMKVCAADDCDAVLVDLSRNRSKRFCDVGNCGNRMNVTAYRARKAAGASA